MAINNIQTYPIRLSVSDHDLPDAPKIIIDKDTYTSQAIISGNRFVPVDVTEQPQIKSHALDVLLGGKVVKDVHITSKDDLEEIKNVSVIMGDLHINCNDLSSQLNLNNIQVVYGNVFIYGATQQTIEKFGFKNLCMITGELSIQNSGIRTFAGFPKLRNVDVIRLEKCPNFINFFGLENLTKLGEIRLKSLKCFDDFNGLENVKELRSLRISDCNSFKNFSYLDNVKSISGIVMVANSSCFESFKGLEKLRSVEKLIVLNNERFMGFSALAQLQQLDELVYSSGLQTMAHTVSNFEGLEQITKLKRLRVYSDDYILNFNGLHNLTEVSDELFIYQLLKLQSLTALQKILHINELCAVGCPKINDLSDLNPDIKIDVNLPDYHMGMLNNYIDV